MAGGLDRRIIGGFVLAALLVSTFDALWAGPSIPMRHITLRTLNKATARVGTLHAQVGTQAQYQTLVINIEACMVSPPTEPPESAAFLQIEEREADAAQAARLFSGWMFASSPSLSTLDHPVYDVWVLNCEPPENAASSTGSASTPAPIDPILRDAPRPKRAPR